MFETIHPNPLIALVAVLSGLIFGFALALLDWKSNFAKGGIITTLVGPLTTLTGDKISTFKAFLESSTLLTPILYFLNIGLGMFVVTLAGGTCFVFSLNFIRGKRRGDPETFIRSARRATAVLGSGLYRYATAQPDLVASNTIRELKKQVETISLIQNTLVNEIATVSTRNVQHFRDTVDAVGRLLLQHSFGESADLQHFRIAFFERRGVIFPATFGHEDKPLSST